ncbi:MAG: hypothetical protein ACJ763_14165 [Bdellovibrionia bacterium]
MKKQSILSLLMLLMSAGAFAGDLLPSLGASSIHYLGSPYKKQVLDQQNTLFSLFEFYWHGPTHDETFVSSLYFVQLSLDGKNLVTEMRVKSPFFTTFLNSRSDTLRVRTGWSLNNCDGNVIKTSSVNWDDIGSVISSFRAYDFAQYMQCEFVRSGAIIVSDANVRPMYVPQIYGHYNSGPDERMIFSDTGDVQFKGVYASDYFRPSQASNPASDQAALNAANTFVSFLKGYGNIMIQLRSATRAERSAALEAYLSRNKAQAIGALTTIKQTLDSTSLMTKLSVTVAINQGYSYVHAMEGSFQAAYPLDEVIVRP